MNTFAIDRTLIDKLNSPNQSEQEQAVEELGRLNSLPAVRLIFTLADDKRYEGIIVKSLSNITNKESLEFLGDMLEFPNAQIRLAALKSLSQNPASSILQSTLNNLLKDPDEQIRIVVAKLTDSGDILVDLLRDNSPLVRETVINKLISQFSDTSDFEDNIIRKALLNHANAEKVLPLKWLIERAIVDHHCVGSPDDMPVAAKPPSVIPHILSSRFGSQKTEALKKRGGNDETEIAVECGLGWLARNQEGNGSWNCAKHNPYHKKLPLPGFVNDDEFVDPAVTGLAVLSFLGAGFTHKDGAYKEVVQKGIQYILSCQDKNGFIDIAKFRSPYNPANDTIVRRYNHNIGTLCLVEAYAMTGDESLKAPAQAALDHSRNTPMPDFGWSYYLEPSDIGPSIFYIMALRIASETDLTVSPNEMDRTKRYISALTDQKTGRIAHICEIPICFGGYDSTATGIVARFLLDASPDNPYQREAAEFIAKHPPVWSPLYKFPRETKDIMYIENDILNEWYWYFGSLALANIGGDKWDDWNKIMKGLLLNHQRHGGEPDGSWDPEGPWATVGGRVYSTAFAIMTLESYYSYLLTTDEHR
ncbi:MAG: hypothetical protein HY762_06380 [Planctomycetes bacterium]|nr:hypothetical protein [Planctomycetota bacterium]